MRKNESASLHQETAARPSRIRRLVTLATCLLTAVLALFLSGFVVFLFCILGPGDRTGRTADGIVVLTGGTDRVAEAANLLAEQRGAVC